jgi:RimJ/RimL family protein N-acetyltransferase
MFIRKATIADIFEAERIYSHAKEFMRENGNPNQWNGDHPNGDDVLEGIERDVSYVCEDGGEVVASFYFEMNADDPTYHKIYEGEWKNDAPYAVIHRIAVKHHGRGIIDFCFKECFRLFPNIRIDTHRDNIPMQKCLKRCGFEYCGIIHLANGDERLAFQRISP